MHKAKDLVIKRIKVGLVITLLAALTGCLGYVDGGYGGGQVFVPEPDVYLFGGGYVGGGYERGRDVHEYSRRGSASRADAHPGSHGGGHERTR